MKLTLILAAVSLLLIVAAFWLWKPDKKREDLVAAYATGPDDFLAVSGVRIHLRTSGPPGAPAIIMLHGLGGSLHGWEPWAQALSDAFRVIRYDFPGAGLSAPDSEGNYSIERDLEVLVAIMDALELKRASLVGHSMGGRIAWNLAAAFPDRVERLVLVAPDGFASPGFEYGKPAALPWSMGLMRHVLPRFLLKMTLAPAYADPGFLSDALLTRYHDLMLAPGSRDAMLERMRQTVLVEPVPILERLRAPTLLVWGKEDAMIPIGNASDYLGAIADSRLVTFPAVGHLPQEEAAGESVAAVREFLAAPR